jgi:N-acetylglutamate synthase-like GNAT family acetyltransferase
VVNEPKVKSDPSGISIRRAEVRDAFDVQHLVRAAYQQYVAAAGYEPAPMKADYSVVIEQGMTWVAEQSDRMIGVLVLEVEDGYLMIENVAVVSEVRGRGLGAQLLSFAENQARELALSEVRLYTGEIMTQNLHYYPRHGYHETHRSYENGLRRVYFAKTL